MKAVALLFLLCVVGCATAPPSITTYTSAPMPSFQGIPYYMTPERCDAFSQQAVKMLHERGIPAHRIVYGWMQMNGARNFHAAVLFELNGRFYFMDNSRQAPRPVAGTTDLACVNHISGDFNTMCWMVNNQNERVAPRKMAELFAPAPEWLKPLQVGQ